MKRRQWMCSGVLLSIMLCIPAAAGSLPKLDTTQVAGWYAPQEEASVNFVILPGDTVCFVDQSGELQSGDFTVAGVKDDFVLIRDDRALCYLHRQEEKSEEVCFAMYYDFLGTADVLSFDEGKQVLAGDYIFDNDYVLCKRQALADFFDVQSREALKVVGRIEGPGYPTPDAAAEAFLSGLAAHDVGAMRRAFACESLAEHLDPEKYLERGKGYWPGMEWIPVSDDMSAQINVMVRSRDVQLQLSYLYGRLIGYNGYNSGGYVSYSKKKETTEDFWQRIMPGRDDTLEISYTVPFELPEELAEDLDEKDIAEYQENMYSYLKPDEVKHVFAFLQVDEAEYLFVMDTVRYDDRWFVMQLGGAVANMAHQDAYRTGLFSWEELMDY